MQRLFHKPADGRPLIERPVTQLHAAGREGGWIWLDVGAPSPQEVVEIGRRFGFDPLSLEDVVEEVHYPKVDQYEHYLLVVLRTLATEGDRLQTSELDAFVGEDFLVTFHDAELPALRRVAENGVRSPALTDGGPDHLLARLADAEGRRYLPLLDSLEDRIEDLEDRAVEADPAVIPELQALRRDVILLRQVAGPQRELLLTLSREGVPLVDRDARLRFADVYDDHYRLVESLDGARLLLGTVLDTYRGAVAERMNEVMKVLTTFAAILLPLSLIAGIYGMNFRYMPELDWRWGYFAVLGLMGAVAVGLWVHFARRGFIGGPRLRKLPRKVGLGLMSLATAPIRTVGWLRMEEEGRDPEGGRRSHG